jgi:Bifunctional DNA primase/polymerase, N-terminal/Primase C terminal 1 (PriCT-1)
MDNTKLLLAQYMELGLHPIHLEGKIAHYYWKEFTLSKDNINWFVKHYSNWGIRTEMIKPDLYFYVVDLDSKDRLPELWEKINLPLGTPIVSTGRGYHFYLTWHSEVKTVHFEGLDVIGNGYVVAPPSIHPNGKQYKFIVPLKDIPPPLMDPETIQLPKMIVNSSGSRACSSNPMTGKLTWQYIENGVSEGLRHTTLVGYIGALIKSCFREEESLIKILAWNKLNRPPLPEDEVIKTIRDCYEKWG